MPALRRANARGGHARGGTQATAGAKAKIPKTIENMTWVIQNCKPKCLALSPHLLLLAT